MGFFDLLATLLGGTVESGMQKINEEQELIERARKLDDDDLIRRCKSETNTKQKMADAYVLKERGYGNKGERK